MDPYEQDGLENTSGRTETPNIQEHTLSTKTAAAIHPVHGDSHYGETVEAAIRSAYGADAFFYPSADRNDPYDGRFVTPAERGVAVLGYGWVEGPHEPKAIPDPEPITSATELLELMQDGGFEHQASDCFIELGCRPGRSRGHVLLDIFLPPVGARYTRAFGEPEDLTIRVNGDPWGAKVLVARLDPSDPGLFQFLEAWVARG